MNRDQERTCFRSLFLSWSHRGPLLLWSSLGSGLAGPWGPSGEVQEEEGVVRAQCH